MVNYLILKEHSAFCYVTIVMIQIQYCHGAPKTALRQLGSLNVDWFAQSWEEDANATILQALAVELRVFTMNRN